MRQVIITAIMEVHDRHSQGWLKDEIREKLQDFAPLHHLTVEHLELPQKVTMALWEGRPFDQLLPDERAKAFDFITAEHKAGRVEFKDMLSLHQKLRDAQATSICPQASDGKHAFSSQGCPAGMQACIHCEEIEL
jgi:hypothetical protein